MRRRRKSRRRIGSAKKPYHLIFIQVSLILLVQFLLLGTFPFSRIINIQKSEPIESYSVTFVTVPKSIYINSTSMVAFKTWLAEFPTAELILYMSIKSVKKQYLDYLKKMFPMAKIIVRRPSTGISKLPLVKGWIKSGLELGNKEFLVYLNSDIVFVKNFSTKFRYMVDLIREKNPHIDDFVMVSDRIDTQYLKPLDEATNIDNLNEYINFTGEFLITGCDIFIFPRLYPPCDFNIMPRFVVGRPAWDSYILRLIVVNSTLISFKNFQPMYHLYHEKVWDADHLPRRIRREKAFHYHLYKKNIGGIDYGMIDHAQIEILGDGSLNYTNRNKKFKLPQDYAYERDLKFTLWNATKVLNQTTDKDEVMRIKKQIHNAKKELKLSARGHPMTLSEKEKKIFIFGKK